MNANEFFVVDRYEALTHEDDYERGEAFETSSICTDHDLPVRGRFTSIEDALRAVCKRNFFEYRRDGWISWAKEYGEEPNRFDFQTMVDENNCEATPTEIKAWKAGRKRLWSRTLTLWLAVRTERDLTQEEALADF